MESFSDIESGAFQLNKIVEKFGESPAIVTAEGVIRYREFFQRIAETAAELRRQKVKPGERVAIIGPNSGEYLILLMALWQIGAVAVVLNTRFPEDQISFLLKKIDCPKLVLLEKSLVLDSRFSILYIRFPNLLPDFKSEITKSEILEGFHPGNCPDDNALAGNPITQSRNH